MEVHPYRLGKRWVFLLMGLGLPVFFLIFSTHFDFSGNFEGIFLLKGGHGSLFELRDDLYLGEGSRLINGIALDGAEARLSNLFRRPGLGEAYLQYKWNERDGCGYVRNFLPDGKEVQTYFSRFLSQGGGHDHGLFVGGGLPSEVEGDDSVKLSETGMAFFDGRRWRHVWCTMNETIAYGPSLDKTAPPFYWRFLGSKVLAGGRKGLALMSRHEATVDGEPLRIDRYAYFRAGETYFILAVNMTNRGRKPVRFMYCYGDEPWVGDYGSSAGNVGWDKDGLIKYEQWVDTGKNSYAGFFDYGNDAAGEGAGFSRTADFIEWLGVNRPNVYFSNACGESPEKWKNVPLAGNTRFIGLEWGPRVLQPGESVEYAVAQGMAGTTLLPASRSSRRSR